ncbi:DsbA family protein [Enterovirga rhinocerotis]|uniref:Protein-disulfide isomerase n=1 Tax=Enterovirga rhinocerotis TaxID=1339210 RepID=A0A4R7BJ83_9HYPH|nr:DsbA family protein [Enterovirga rhinocerotis]TDR85394.1 protein-disulfide isomerase [Enterovirga rhinocerotis]
MLLKRRLRPAILLIAAAIGLSAPSLAQTPSLFSAEQRRAIEGIVREYLVTNPEVLQEAIVELEKRQNEAQRKAQQAALTEVREAVVSAKHGVVVGNASGDVTLVEFFDYNCGFCKRALGDLRGLMKADGKLRVVLRDLPVLGPDSVEASRVAMAAKAQLSGDRAFEYHARLLETRGRIGGEQALKLAKEMGLDVARIQRDVNGAEVQQAVATNTMLAERLGLTGTPAYVVGEEVISGAVGIEPLRQAIETARKCGNASC